MRFLNHPNLELIQQSINEFTAQIETLDSKALTEIIKNYKLLLEQMDESNGELLKDLIDMLCCLDFFFKPNLFSRLWH